MKNYRLYRIDGAGRISAAEWLEAVDDCSARSQAAALCIDGGIAELWVRDRLVARVETPRDAVSIIPPTVPHGGTEGLPPGN